MNAVWFLIILWTGSPGGFFVGPFKTDDACHAAQRLIQAERPAAKVWCVRG